MVILPDNGHLWSIRAAARRRRQLREQSLKKLEVTLVGSNQVGKTSLLKAFDPSLMIREDDPPTCQVRTTILGSSRTVTFKELARLGEKHFPLIQSSHGFIVVYSIDSQPTFETAERYLDMIFKFKDWIDSLSRILLIGTKSNPDGASGRQVSIMEGEKLANRYCAGFIEVNLQDLSHVREAFGSLLENIVVGVPFLKNALAIGMTIKSAR